jgi:hypothetical protein
MKDFHSFHLKYILSYYFVHEQNYILLSFALLRLFGRIFSAKVEKSKRLCGKYRWEARMLPVFCRAAEAYYNISAGYWLARPE